MALNSHLSQMTSQLFLSQLVSFCMRRGWSADDVFRHAGFDLAQLRIGQRIFTQDDFIPVLISIAQRKNMPDIALQLGQEVHSEQLGLFGALISSSPNLSVAVQRFSQFNQLLDDRFQLSLLTETDELCPEEDKLWLIYAPHQDSTNHPFYAELLFSAVATHAHQFSRFNAKPMSMAFSHPKPAYADCYHHYFSCPILFGQAQNRMQLPSKTAEAPFATQNTRYHQHALAEAKKLLPQQNSSRSAEVIQYFNNHLANADACQLKQVSKALSCSSRTLQRELQAENTTLKQLLDNTRKTAACAQLKNTHASIESISQSVGFDYPSSFTAKFKQWTGKTPRQFRDDSLQLD